MKELLVLGGGTAGTIVVNRLNRRLDKREWRVTVVDQDNRHAYQPGFLFVPFDGNHTDDLVRPRVAQFDSTVRFINGSVQEVRTADREVHLDWGLVLSYDQLVIATGTSPFRSVPRSG